MSTPRRERNLNQRLICGQQQTGNDDDAADDDGDNERKNLSSVCEPRGGGKKLLITKIMIDFLLSQSGGRGKMFGAQ